MINENDEFIDSSNDEIDNDNSETTDDVETLKAQLAEKEELNRRLYERAKKAETKLKTNTKAPISNNDVDRDELKLIARGLSDEEIEQAKIIAKGTGSNLLEAMKNPLFQAFQEKLKEDQRKEQAKLGASQGTSYAEDATVAKSGMSRDEHKELFKKALR